MNGFAIRDATSGDTPAIREICRLSFGPIYEHYAVQSLKSEGPTFVSEAGGVVIGFVKLVQSRIGNNDVGDILWLAVRPSFRRRNVGSALITDSVSYFEGNGVRRIHASVERRNKSAMALFQRSGFHKLSFRDLLKIYGRHILRFYSEFWVPPTEVVLMYGRSA